MSREGGESCNFSMKKIEEAQNNGMMTPSEMGVGDDSIPNPCHESLRAEENIPVERSPKLERVSTVQTNHFDLRKGKMKSVSTLHKKTPSIF